MNQIEIPEGGIGEVSDGYHTFNELYDHRFLLWINLMQQCEYPCVKSRKNSDGSEWDGWFVAGMTTPYGQISYHLPVKYWGLLDIDEYETFPDYDGHTSFDVIDRLGKMASL